MSQPEQPSQWQALQLLAQLNAKLDVLIAQGTDHETRIRMLERGNAQSDDHEARLTTLEKSRWPLANITAVVAIATLLLAAFALYVKR